MQSKRNSEESNNPNFMRNRANLTTEPGHKHPPFPSKDYAQTTSMFY